MNGAPGKGFHWLASYPKSGNTWLRLALRSLEQGGVPISLAQPNAWAPIVSALPFFEQALDVEAADLTLEEIERLRPRALEVEAREAPGPLFRKVHDAWTLTPEGEPLFPPRLTLGTLIIVRDPRDVAVSYAHFAGISLDRSIAFLANPQAQLAPSFRDGEGQMRQHLGSWSDHVASWLEAPGMNPLLLRYEEMKADPLETLRQAARHVGWNPTEEGLARATEATRFETLQAIERREGFGGKGAGKVPFFRRGEVGGWRDVLTPAQQAALEEAHGPMMARLGYL
ncbi:MAG: sulfotransferase domain-containing protein [Magnetococcales bacterium]|nr:sulfotransferase domain-containing protein [Magnetococcales bacterium]